MEAPDPSRRAKQRDGAPRPFETGEAERDGAPRPSRRAKGARGRRGGLVRVLHGVQRPSCAPENALRRRARVGPRPAMEDAAARFKGKVVMDVGAGSGILSLLAARAGARKVFAVEASDMARTIALTARENGFGDVVTVLHGRAEDVELPVGFSAVDVIVSEWMAIFLVQEGMLDSVLFARDKWLRPETGTMFPCRAAIYVQPCDMSEERSRELSFWSNVHGFKFGVLQQRNREAQTAGPHRKTVRADQVVAPPVLLAGIDLHTVDVASLAVIEHDAMRFECSRPFCTMCFWWTTTFPAPIKTNDDSEKAKPQESQDAVVLSTATDAPPTHWEQGVIHLPGLIGPADGSAFRTPPLRVSLRKSAENHRNYDISVESA